MVTGLAVLAFELCEHVIFLLVWNWRMRRRSPLTGLESMLGKQAQVLRWNNTTGLVCFDGEQWKAESLTVLAPGDLVLITAVRSLTLTVVPFRQESDNGASL